VPSGGEQVSQLTDGRSMFEAKRDSIGSNLWRSRPEKVKKVCYCVGWSA
jgi:hypothetical protein